MSVHELAMAILNHAFQLTLLTGLVWCIVKLFARNRPHLAHALWILVLIKCVVPPAWSSPTSVFYWINTPIDQNQFLSQATPEYSSTSPVRQDNNTLISNSPEYQLSVAVDKRSTLPAASESAVIKPPSNPNVSKPWQPFAKIPRTVIAGGIIVLLIGFAVGLLLTCIRLLYFLKAAYSKGYYSDAEINNLVRQLSKRLGVKRIVRVRLVRNPIGPVVLGLIRPTLLLPELIVRGKKQVELEPLIAHELIHIRRGDLWWSMLQAVATSLWWFHPLVRLAGRMVSRETERSCDEETIASLGCSPAAYARSLLDVLERKHQLKIAPALPGVRPIELTLDRMERIMKLGQGSHKRAPSWIWAAMLIGCAVALPSGSVGVAQDTDKLDAVTTAQAVGPVPKANGDFTKHWQIYREDVGDLIDAFKEQGMSNEEAQRWILSQLPLRKQEDAGVPNLRVNRILVGGYVNSDLGLSGQYTVDERVNRVPLWGDVNSDLELSGQLTVVHVPAPQILDRELQVSDTKSKIDKIKTKLIFLRENCRKLVSCEVKVVSFTQDAFKEVSRNWVKVEYSRTTEQSAVAEDHATQTKQSTAPSQTKLAFHSANSDSYVLNDQDFDAVTTRKDVHCLTGSKVTGRSGQTIFMNFHPNLKPVDGKLLFLEGICLELQPTIIEGDKVSLQAQCLRYNPENRVEDFSNKKRPMNGTGGHSRRVLEAMRISSPTGRVSQQATKRLAEMLNELGKLEEAADTFNDLLATYPDSEHHLLTCEAQLDKAIALCVHTKIGGEDGVLALLVRCSVVDSPNNETAAVTRVLSHDYTNGFFVKVEGAVKQPGRYKLDRPTTVAQAIASARGFQAQGSLFEVTILGQVDGGSDYVVTDFVIDSALIGKEVTQADEIWLKQADIVLVKSISPAIASTHAKIASRTNRKRVFEGVPLIGPVTAGEQPHAISPPTDDEVISAINALRKRDGKYAIVCDPDHLIELVKLSESEDDQRFVP